MCKFMKRLHSICTQIQKDYMLKHATAHILKYFTMENKSAIMDNKSAMLIKKINNFS